MIPLPPVLAPPPPFPLVIAQSTARAFIAPGMTLATYHVQTTNGPLVVHVTAIDLHEPTIRIATVLANDALVSAGETVSSMARRTGAIAGINADYYDIGQTNQPLNIVVRDGMLLRTPSGRATLTVSRDRSVRFGTYRFAGSVSDGDRRWALGGVDEWPPQGAGTMLVQREFGAPLARGAGITFVHVEPKAPRAGGPSGDFRVVAVDRDISNCADCMTFAFGVRAASIGALPVPGDALHVEAALEPPIDDAATAVGGGPLLVRDGALYDDPDPPSPSEALHHDPQAGAIRRADGSLALIEVDGRAANVSLGLTRPEFGALMLALGSVDGMAFDSGGSATLVARVPGDAQASVQGVPSDGHERKVADGLFIYSAAAAGPPSRLAVRPSPLTVLAGTAVTLSVIPTDAAGHPAGAQAPPTAMSVDPPELVRIEPGGTLVAVTSGSGIVHVRRAGLEADVPLRVVAALASLRIEPPNANPERGGKVAFRARGADGSGAPVAVGGSARWAASAGQIDADGGFTAAGRDAVVTLRAAGRQATAIVRVGSTQAPLAVFSSESGWTFATVPAGGRGSATVTNGESGDGSLELVYDFALGVRAAYANAAIALPGQPLAIALDVRGDGGGGGLRAAFDNADGDRIAVTLARRVDWRGWRRCTATLPHDAVAPLRLRSLYLVAALGGPPARGPGSVAFRTLLVTFAGSSPATQPR
jgi:exopolysaccharide biosynthesis protein